MKLFFDDLDRDCGFLSLSARGAWVWILGNLHFHDGEMTLCIKEWARMIGANIPETISALEEIIDAKVCNSNFDKIELRNALSQNNNAQITVMSRRISREVKQRKQNALRQHRFRRNADSNDKSNGSVTVERLEAKKLEAIYPLNPPRDRNAENLSLDSMFLILWECYPANRRNKKQESQFEFSKLRPDKKLFETILSSIDILKQTEEWSNENGRYVPGLLKWIQARGWESVRIETHCKTCNETGVIVRSGEKILPWTIEREVNQALKPEVCPDCNGKNRLNTPGLPDVKFE